MTSVDARVVRVLSRAGMVPVESVTPDALLAALEIKSLEQIECILALEDEFHIELPQQDLRRLLTVQDVIDVVRQALPR
jgi:acyl carrier protein